MDTIFAVSQDELGDIFVGTISQFQDCFCSNEMETLEDVEFHAKGMFGQDVIVQKVAIDAFTNIVYRMI
jgi:hypothetical protein